MKRIVYVLLFLPLFLVAQDRGDTVVSKQSIKDLNHRIYNLEKKVDDGKVAIDNAKTMIEISKGYSGTANDLVTRWSTLFAIIVSLAGITGYYGLKEYIKNRLDKILNQKEEVIADLFDKHELEKSIISKSKILIINKDDTTVNEYLEKILKKFANKIDKEDVVDLSSHKFKYKFKNYDLVLFDNTNTTDEEKNWKDGELKERLVDIVKEVCDSNVAFLFFGKVDGGFARSPKLTSYLHLINYSNSPSTAFSNIINLLNFRKLLLNK